MAISRANGRWSNTDFVCHQRSDNRPLNFDEFEERVGQTIYVSATPGPYELTKTSGEVIEQIIRPTGLMDPEVEVRPVKGQIDHLLEECRMRAERNERVLVTTLTKKMAEDLTEYFTEVDVRVRYLHSDIETLERIKILRDLRRGEFDVLVGINLLREGSGPAGSFAGGDSRCGQGRVSAFRVVADPDHWPRGAQRERQSDSLRRPDH